MNSETLRNLISEIEKEFTECPACEIKGLMVDRYGNPKVIFETQEDVDKMVDCIEEICLSFLRQSLYRVAEEVSKKVG